MQTIEEARASIGRLRTDGLPWDIRLDVHDAAWGDLPPVGYEGDAGLEIVIAWSPIDVDTGAKTTIRFHLAVRPGEDVLDAGRRAIRVIALHEIDEQLTVDGVRRWEPHLTNGGRRQPILARVEDDAG